MRKWKSFLAIMFFGLSQICFGLQVRAIKDNQSASFKIPAKAITRIFVAGDRIQNVRGLDGAYDIRKDDKLGEIYLQPTAYYQNKSFNVFITTENGLHYTLTLVPSNTKSDVIEIKPVSPVLKQAAIWEKNSAYSEVLIKLIDAMVNRETPEGYAVIPLGDDQHEKTISKNLILKLSTIYRGNHLQGEIWYLCNKGNKPIYINQHLFDKRDVRAISWQNAFVKPFSSIMIYKVVDNG